MRFRGFPAVALKIFRERRCYGRVVVNNQQAWHRPPHLTRTSPDKSGQAGIAPHPIFFNERGTEQSIFSQRVKKKAVHHPEVPAITQNIQSTPLTTRRRRHKLVAYQWILNLV
jgi:hypothetical protein